MLEILKTAGRNAIALKDQALDRLPHGRRSGGRSGRVAKGLMIGAPLAALLVIAGCSWFSDESTPEPTPAKPTASQAKAPEPGEGESMSSNNANGSGTVTSNGSETASSAGTIPDINSVPTEAPKPSIDLTQTPNGLGSDTANAQHTDETLTMPNETAERPVPPGQENAPSANGQAASVQATAPETPAAPPAVAPEAATPPAEAAATPTPAPAPAPATPAPAAQPEVALAGTPEAGATPFEPSGPLHLAPGSLNRNAPQPAAVASMAPAQTPAPAPEATALAPMPAPAAETTQEAAAPSISATPMPSVEPSMPAAAPTAPAPSGSAVSVDYSVLNALQSGSAQNGAMPMASAPMTTNSAAAQIAGVGQAVGYVYFGNDSAALSPADRQVLAEVVQLQRIQGGVLRIVGHASQRTGNLDAMAQNRVNQRVSLQRATAVAQALVGMGVQPMLVQVAAAGDSQTLYSESTPAGEAGNRRAEVYLSQN